MERYDPLQAPDPEVWLAMDDGDRTALVSQYHRRAHIELPNRRIHAALHAIVETQVAMGAETPVQRTLERLQAEGLDRHDAIHAIGSILARQLHALAQTGEAPGGDPNEWYRTELGKLTAKGWKVPDR